MKSGIARLNPVILAVLNFDRSALLFLALKIGLSLSLITYWKMVANIRIGISAMALIGTVVYSSFIFMGLVTILTA